MQGWIKLHRKIVDWEWYDDLPTKSLFIHLLLLANHEDNMWHGQKIEKGSLITSLSSLSVQTGLSVKQVRTALNHLEKTGEIGKQRTNNNTLIIVLNYARYQEFESSDKEENGKRGASKGQTKGRQRATNKNDKNDKNAKNERNTYIREIVAYLNSAVGSNYKWQSDATQKHIIARLNDGYSVEDFKKVIDVKCSEWLNTERCKYLRPSTLFGTKFDEYLNQNPKAVPRYYCEY